MRRAQAYLIPLFFFAVLALLATTLFVFSDTGFGEEKPVIGEKQHAVLEAYSDADALRHYAQHAAQHALEQAVTHALPSQVEQETKNRFQELMREHPTHPVFTPFTLTRSGDDFRLASSTEVTIPITYGKEASGVGTAGLFSSWPLPTERNDYYVSSVFGKRDLGGEAGSTNHPGIDLRAAIGTPVYSLATGNVTRVVTDPEKADYVFVAHDNGWTCGYFHARATVSTGQRVEQGQQIAEITDDGFAPHLDLRCHPQPGISEQEAKNTFGAQHVGRSTSMPADTTYGAVAYAPSGTQTYIDPYCLFTPLIQENMRRRVQEAGTQRISGLQDRFRREGTIEEKLTETCEVYASAGVLERRSEGVAQGFTNSLILQTFENEGVECHFDETENGGWTKFGVKEDTLAAYRGQSSATRAQVCALTEQEATQIYLEQYLTDPGFDALPPEILPNVFDAGVNTGPGTAKNHLADVLQEEGYLEEGRSASMAQIVSASEEALADGVELNSLYTDRRIQYYERLAQQPDKAPNLEGWKNRAEKYRDGVDWARLARNAMRSGSYGSYAFEIEVSASLNNTQRQTLRHREALYLALRACEHDNATCIDTMLRVHGPGFAACTDYEQQLAQTWNACEPGCDCQLPLPTQQMGVQTLAFTQDSAVINGSVLPLDWTHQYGEGAQDVFIGVRGADADNFTWSASNPEQLVMNSDGQQRVLAVNGSVYVQAYPETGMYAVVFGNTTQQACGQRVERTYCAPDQELVVDHPTTTP